jgi:hypothetical protein
MWNVFLSAKKQRLERIDRSAENDNNQVIGHESKPSRLLSRTYPAIGSHDMTAAQSGTRCRRFLAFQSTSVKEK